MTKLQYIGRRELINSAGERIEGARALIAGLAVLLSDAMANDVCNINAEAINSTMHTISTSLRDVEENVDDKAGARLSGIAMLIDTYGILLSDVVEATGSVPLTPAALNDSMHAMSLMLTDVLEMIA